MAATQKGLDGLETGLYYPTGSAGGYGDKVPGGPSVAIIKQWELEEARKDERAMAAIAKSQWLIENRSWCFFDLETTNLKANFGEILVGCIKPRGKKAEVYAADEAFGDGFLVEQLAERLLDFDYIVTWYGCTVPGTRILTQDLRWVPVETLQPGDSLLAFDEMGPRRKWCTSTVINNVPIVKKCVEIKMDDGTCLVVTYDHPLLLADGRWIEAARWRNMPILRQVPV